MLSVSQVGGRGSGGSSVWWAQMRSWEVEMCGHGVGTDGFEEGGTHWLANEELPGGAGTVTGLQSFSESYFPLYCYCSRQAQS